MSHIDLIRLLKIEIGNRTDYIIEHHTSQLLIYNIDNQAVWEDKTINTASAVLMCGKTKTINTTSAVLITVYSVSHIPARAV